MNAFDRDSSFSRLLCSSFFSGRVGETDTGVTSNEEEVRNEEPAETDQGPSSDNGKKVRRG